MEGTFHKFKYTHQNETEQSGRWWVDRRGPEQYAGGKLEFEKDSRQDSKWSATS